MLAEENSWREDAIKIFTESERPSGRTSQTILRVIAKLMSCNGSEIVNTEITQKSSTPKMYSDVQKLFFFAQRSYGYVLL